MIYERLWLLVYLMKTIRVVITDVLVRICVEWLCATEATSPHINGRINKKVQRLQHIRSQTGFELAFFGIQLTGFTNETIHK